ncbi:MAG: 4-hydroxy-tetrahydrodipicolinate synthase, partial [Bacteroidales bacterium]
DLTGISAILSVTPYYNRPSQEGLYEHYMEIGRHSPLPVILYNVRSRTACNLDAETTLKLAYDCQNIIGIKEASGNMNQIMKVVKHKPQDFLVISGDDAITLPLMAAGIDGLISVVANAYPKEVAQMIHLAMQDHFADARNIHHHLLDITQACFKEGNPAGVKTFLAIQGKIGYHLRLPLTRVSTELQKYIKEIATV